MVGLKAFAKNAAKEKGTPPKNAMSATTKLPSVVVGAVGLKAFAPNAPKTKGTRERNLITR